MTHYMITCAPNTYDKINKSFDKYELNRFGFKEHWKTTCSGIKEGDKFITFLTYNRRFVGVLKVLAPCYADEQNKLYFPNDPFIIHFRIEPTVWLPLDKTIPIKDVSLQVPIRNFQISLQRFPCQEDGELLEKLLFSQMQENAKIYEISKEQFTKDVHHCVGYYEKDSFTQNPDIEQIEIDLQKQRERKERESLKRVGKGIRPHLEIQCLLVLEGIRRGNKVWIANNDRKHVMEKIGSLINNENLLTDFSSLDIKRRFLKKVVLVDILWIKDNRIVRAFEVEHSSQIHTGIQRMLHIPLNHNTNLHIVSSEKRRENVFEEIANQTDIGALQTRSCTYLSYGSVVEVSELKDIQSSDIERYEEKIDLHEMKE